MGFQLEALVDVATKEFLDALYSVDPRTCVDRFVAKTEDVPGKGLLVPSELNAWFSHVTTAAAPASAGPERETSDSLPELHSANDATQVLNIWFTTTEHE
jgi:hypothetical protein